MFMTLVKKSPISITVSRSGFDAFMAMRSRVINAKLGQFRDEIVSVSSYGTIERLFDFSEDDEKVFWIVRFSV